MRGLITSVLQWPLMAGAIYALHAWVGWSWLLSIPVGIAAGVVATLALALLLALFDR